MVAANPDDADADTCCFLSLRLPDPMVQMERRLTPGCSADTAAFVLFVAGADEDTTPPLAVSPAARRLGVAADAPLAELRRGALADNAVRFIPAASWDPGAAAGLNTQEALAAYARVAEQGPWALCRKVVAGEGLELLGEDGRAALEERHVRVPADVERARELGQELQEEVRRLLGYQLTVGVALDLDNARREARGLLLLSRGAGARVGAGRGGSNDAKEEATGPERATATAASPTVDREDIQVAEFFCEVCRAFFFEASALLAHMQERHQPPRAGPHAQGGGSGDDADEELVGPGRVPFTAALGGLTDPAAIETFLADIGAAAGV